MRSNWKFAIGAAGALVAAFAAGSAEAQSTGAVIAIDSPVIGLNIATVTQTGGPNNAVVKQSNAGQIGVSGDGASGSVVAIRSPVVGVNVATVTQIGGSSNAAVQQFNFGQIGIRGVGLIHW
jgi:hypothetical protein